MSLSKSSLMFAVVALVTCTAMAEQDTCAIADPPSEAGEQAHMGELLLVYPRARDIGEAFTGCQSLWGRAKAGTHLIGRFEYMKGSFVAVHDGEDRIRCEYGNGKLISVLPTACPKSLPSPIPSLPPGCFSKVQRAIETNDTTSPGCSKFE